MKDLMQVYKNTAQSMLSMMSIAWNDKHVKVGIDYLVSAYLQGQDDLIDVCLQGRDDLIDKMREVKDDNN